MLELGGFVAVVRGVICSIPSPWDREARRHRHSTHLAARSSGLCLQIGVAHFYHPRSRRGHQRFPRFLRRCQTRRRRAKPKADPRSHIFTCICCWQSTWGRVPGAGQCPVG